MAGYHRVVPRESAPPESPGVCPRYRRQPRANATGFSAGDGDIVCGDADGVAVIPKDRADEINRSADERSSHDTGPNSIVNIPFRTSRAEPVARLHAMPSIEWKWTAAFQTGHGEQTAVF